MNPNLHTSPEHEFEAQLGLLEKLPKGNPSFGRVRLTLRQ